MTSVLVIDDETALLRALRINLTARDYTVTTAADGAAGLAAMARDRPDVVIIDLGLPDMDGTEVIRGIRGWSTTPIIVLSARGQEIQKVDALDAGADDYITKPFGMNELLARLRAATRRGTPAVEEPVVTTGHFSIDLAAKRVTTTARRGHPAHPHRVAAARNPGPPPRPTRHRPATPPRRLGPQLRHRNPLPARLHRPTTPKTRTRPRPAPLPDHRTRHRLPPAGRISVLVHEHQHHLGRAASLASAPASAASTSRSVVTAATCCGGGSLMRRAR